VPVNRGVHHPQLPHGKRRAQFRDQFLECVGVVTEALAELAIKA